jgi:hypothetical protein
VYTVFALFSKVQNENYHFQLVLQLIEQFLPPATGRKHVYCVFITLSLKLWTEFMLPKANTYIFIICIKYMLK